MKSNQAQRHGVGDPHEARSGPNVIIPRYNCRAATLANRLSSLEKRTPMSWLIPTLQHYAGIVVVWEQRFQISEMPALKSLKESNPINVLMMK
jgi:hypothetical protein